MAKIIGNTTATPYPRPDWAQDDSSKADYIKNKPTLGALAAKDDISKEDLSLEVQESLSKADTAIQSLDGMATEEFVTEAIGKIPTPDVSGQINEHNVSETAHGDIRGLISGIEESKLDANELSNAISDALAQAKESGEFKGDQGAPGADGTNGISVTHSWNGTELTVTSASGTSSADLIGETGKSAYQYAQDGGYLGTEEEFSAKLNKEYLTTETDPTVPAWAKTTSKPTYTATEVGADPAGSASAVQGNLDIHTTNKSNPHGVTLSQLGVNATSTELNYVKGVTSGIQTQLNNKANDFSIEIYNGTGGNPKPVKFASFNYSTCGSDHGIAAKISLVSGHGNGTHYAFLEDVIIKVNYLGTVNVDNFKYYGISVSDNGVQRQYGDIFWVIDTTNKIVDFYVLMGQYSYIYQTPWKRLTYSSKGTVTQYTSCTVYSSGEKNWANNSEFALMSDVTSALNSIPTPDVSGQINTHNTASDAHSDIRSTVNSLASEVAALKSSVVTVYAGSADAMTADVGSDGDIYWVTD